MNRRDGSDVRDLLGMRSVAAVVLVTVFGVTLIVTAVHTSISLWQTTAAATVCALAWAGVMYLPGDPLPRWSAAALAAAAPVSALLVSLPVLSYQEYPSWLIMGMIAYLVFMCVRGAIGWAWTGLLSGNIILAAGSAGSEFAGEIAAGAAIEGAPVLIATYFAFAVRPTARSIFRLRAEAETQAAREAATSAMMDERDAQLDRLDAVARPLLTRIAAGTQLPPDEQEECQLLEAQLRDRLRAGLIVDEAVADAARAARARGVSVTMLDDGLATAAETVRDAVRRAVTTALRFAPTGSVAVRALPPGRDHAATVLVRAGDAEYRVEVDRTGHIRSDL